MNRRLATALLFGLTACPPPTPTPDGGTTTPIVTSISPVTGPIAGGTTVTINGTNFVAGATVTFGALAATTTTFDSDRKLTAITPASAAGPVSVTVTNPAGKSSTLANAFTFAGTTSTTTITESILQNPADSTDTSGSASVSINVIAHVQVPTITTGTGQGAGVRAQVGFATTVGATPTVSDFTWTDSAYVGDVDGSASGDKARDSYSGAVTLPSPTSGSQLIYFLAARFSVDGGQTWSAPRLDGREGGGVSAIAIARTRPQTIYAGVYGKGPAGLFASMDGGVTWRRLF